MARAAGVAKVLATDRSVKIRRVLAVVVALTVLSSPALAVGSQAAGVGVAQLFPVAGSMDTPSRWSGGFSGITASLDGSLLIPLGQAVERPHARQPVDDRCRPGDRVRGACSAPTPHRETVDWPHKRA